MCLNAETGKLIWWRDVAPVFIDRQRQGAGPRATPTYHDGRIYCLFPRGELVCFSANDGKKLWQTNILAATDAGNHAGLRYYWGMSASPLIEKDLVIVQPGGASNNAVAAFHKDTGKLVWKAGSGTPGYGSPIAIDADGTRQVICSNGRSILSVDPTNGKVLWEYRFGSQYNCNCATPLWVDNKLFLSSAYGVGSTALAVGRGGVREIWKNRNLMNQFATSMIIDGHVYGSHGDFSGLSLRVRGTGHGQTQVGGKTPRQMLSDRGRKAFAVPHGTRFFAVHRSRSRQIC
ncbi:MAG: hypothetical protein KatS3mg105_2753 [Gemmatales bacterium]|nr:MAG: hypothetical protein KatS3mg105_2753 [Gemmatales bacterium]